MDEAIYPIINNPDRSLLTAAGIGRCDRQYHCVRRDGYPIPQINFCTDGKGILIAGGNTTEITKGMSFFLPADIPHEYYTEGALWSLEWVTFSGICCNGLLEQLEMTEPLTVMHKDSTEMKRAWNGIYSALKRNGKNDTLRADSYMYRYLAEYHISRTSSREKDSDTSAFRLAEEFISSHFTEELTMERLSAAANVSPQYLCRIFKQRTGMRPFQYINCRRLQYAKQLLTRSNMTVSEISHIAGYNDTSYFCKLFKEQEGVSPKKFMSAK